MLRTYSFLLLILQTLSCPVGKVGKNCEFVDPCAAPNNPCNNGQICQGLDSEFRPVCACPLGMHGFKCTERNCPIQAYNGNSFINTFYFDSEHFDKIERINELAFDCKVIVNVTKSFAKLIKPTDEVDDKDLHIFVGQGVEFELLDDKKRTLCDTKCLETHKTIGFQNIGKEERRESPVECFLNKLGNYYSTTDPGVLKLKDFSSQSKEDLDLLKARQVGCLLRNDLPKLTVSKLIGIWKLIRTENCDPYLKCQGVSWFSRQVLSSVSLQLTVKKNKSEWKFIYKFPLSSVEQELSENKTVYQKIGLTGLHSGITLSAETKDILIMNAETLEPHKCRIQIRNEVIHRHLTQTHRCDSGSVCTHVFKRLDKLDL